MALQVGDIIALTKIAGQLLDYGFNKNLNCSRQYCDFGQDVQALAQNLNILADVIEGADHKLKELTLSHSARLRWDSRSLSQIIGDCQQTLYECFDLLQRNSRFAPRANPLKSIEWNILVQGDVDALRKRIQQHSIKIHLALAPFEIDLLSRIQQDIHRMHRDLASRIDRVHEDVLRIRGVVIPDLQQELNQKDAREPHTIRVPLNLEYAFESTYSTRDPPSLEDLADIFVTFFYESTVCFKPPTPLARDKVPPDEQWINLLKCVWLMQKIKTSEKLQSESMSLESHWPSYVEELEKVLSEQCRRFEGELAIPTQPNVTTEAVAIWPSKPKTTVLDEVEKEQLIETVLSTKINHASENRTLDLHLLRKLDEGGNEFRINILGEEQSRRINLDPIDFDLRKAILRPHYALDSKAPYDMILETGQKLISLHFPELKEAMKFQHATTGYRVLGYKQYLVDVKFVFSGQKEAVPTHEACLQIWIPSTKEGNLGKTSETRSISTSPSQTPNVLSNTTEIPIGMSTVQSSRAPTSSFFQDAFPPEKRDNVHSGFFGTQRQLSINSLYLSPLQVDFSQFPDSRRRSNGDRISPLSTSGPSNYNYLSGRNTILSSSPPIDEPMLSGSPSAQQTSLPGRSPSVSTIRPQPSIDAKSSSSGSEHTQTIVTGAGNMGFLHVPPAKPILVLLTQDTRTGVRTMVTLDLTTTDVNPQRCNCRRDGRIGAECRDVSLERSSGHEGKPLDARRFEPLNPAQPDWDVARLAFSRRNESDVVKRTLWRDLTRVTITFRDPADKTKFKGMGWCGCKNRGGPKETLLERRMCVTRGHRGLLGEAKEHYADRRVEFDAWRNSRQHVVNGLRPDVRP